jgi:hypothetical protein
MRPGPGSARKTEQVTETVTLPGLEGRPATAREMEWLVRRSIGIGLPAPSTLCPAEQGEWGPDDMHSFADSVEVAGAPLGRTVQLTSRGLNNPVERHVAVMSVGRLEELEAPDPGREPWLAHTDKVMVVDLYDPFHLEQLELSRETSEHDVRVEVVASTVAVLNEQIARGDFFLCASEKQRDFWLGDACASGGHACPLDHTVPVEEAYA